MSLGNSLSPSIRNSLSINNILYPNNWPLRHCFRFYLPPSGILISEPLLLRVATSLSDSKWKWQRYLGDSLCLCCLLSYHFYFQVRVHCHHRYRSCPLFGGSIPCAWLYRGHKLFTWPQNLWLGHINKVIIFISFFEFFIISMVLPDIISFLKVKLSLG